MLFQLRGNDDSEEEKATSVMKSLYVTIESNGNNNESKTKVVITWT